MANGERDANNQNSVPRERAVAVLQVTSAFHLFQQMRAEINAEFDLGMSNPDKLPQSWEEMFDTEKVTRAEQTLLSLRERYPSEYQFIRRTLNEHGTIDIEEVLTQLEADRNRF